MFSICVVGSKSIFREIAKKFLPIHDDINISCHPTIIIPIKKPHDMYIISSLLPHANQLIHFIESTTQSIVILSSHITPDSIKKYLNHKSRQGLDFQTKNKQIDIICDKLNCLKNSFAAS